MLRRVLLTVGFALLVGTGVTGGTSAQADPANNTPAQVVSVQAADTGPCPYSASKPHPQLSQGSRGEPVAHLQCLLRNVWKYDLAVDGDFGPITEYYVRMHQADCHIDVDGIVGPVTWNRLHPDSTTAQCRDAGRN